jgi:undecaprenyl pyrophosphate synthase
LRTWIVFDYYFTTLFFFDFFLSDSSLGISHGQLFYFSRENPFRQQREARKTFVVFTNLERKERKEKWLMETIGAERQAKVHNL